MVNYVVWNLWKWFEINSGKREITNTSCKNKTSFVVLRQCVYVFRFTGGGCYPASSCVCPLIIQIFGLAVLGIGIWLVIEGNNYGETLTGDGYVAGGALLIVCGIITLFVSIVGMVGACFLLRIVLLIVSLLIYSYMVVPSLSAAQIFITYSIKKSEARKCWVRG